MEFGYAAQELEFLVSPVLVAYGEVIEVTSYPTVNVKPC